MWLWNSNKFIISLNPLKCCSEYFCKDQEYWKNSDSTWNKELFDKFMEDIFKMN